MQFLLAWYDVSFCFKFHFDHYILFKKIRIPIFWAYCIFIVGLLYARFLLHIALLHYLFRQNAKTRLRAHLPLRPNCYFIWYVMSRCTMDTLFNVLPRFWSNYCMAKHRNRLLYEFIIPIWIAFLQNDDVPKLSSKPASRI